MTDKQLLPFWLKDIIKKKRFKNRFHLFGKDSKYFVVRNHKLTEVKK